MGLTQPWDHVLTGPAGAAVWPVCVDGVPSKAIVQSLQRCVHTDARLLLVHGMHAVYRVQVMEEWTAEDVLGVERLQPWAGVTSQLQTARVARGPRTCAYGHVPRRVLEHVFHLVEDFRLDSAMEVDLAAAGAPPKAVRVRYMRATPHRYEWYGYGGSACDVDGPRVERAEREYLEGHPRRGHGGPRHFPPGHA